MHPAASRHSRFAGLVRARRPALVPLGLHQTQLASPLLVLRALRVAVSTEDLAAAHVVVSITAAVRIVLEGFVVLVHWRHLLRERGRGTCRTLRARDASRQRVFLAEIVRKRLTVGGPWRRAASPTLVWT